MITNARRRANPDLAAMVPNSVAPNTNHGVSVAKPLNAVEAEAHPTRTRQAEEEAHEALLRDLTGLPFGVRAPDPAWLSWENGQVVRLAQELYDDRRFDELPVLADALEEAGCVDERVLEHCRSPHLHARGCWLLDMLIGKESGPSLALMPCLELGPPSERS